jgi:uncharacterized protein YbbK (DUF523 family)
LGVSACLLGDPVRWDGDHDRSAFLADRLAPHVVWRRVCPELEIGLGVPREPIALVRQGDGHALVAATSRRALTETMASFAKARVDGFHDLDGYVLKSRSPSCGIAGARVYATREDLFADASFERAGRGVYASALLQRWPTLPIVEETQLQSAAEQAHFVERCFAMRRARRLLDVPADARAEAVAAFAEAHELQLLCRSAGARKELARAAAEPAPSEEALRDFVAWFARVMAEEPDADRVVGVLRRVVNRLRVLDPSSAGDWEAAVSDVAGGRESALALRVRFHAAAAELGDEALTGQTFLAPEPGELAAYRAIESGAARAEQ